MDKFKNLWDITHDFDERMKIGDEWLNEILIIPRNHAFIYAVNEFCGYRTPFVG